MSSSTGLPPSLAISDPAAVQSLQGPPRRRRRRWWWCGGGGGGGGGGGSSVGEVVVVDDSSFRKMDVLPPYRTC
eukprot:767804-Hanusia_phi.AAC.2